MAGGLEIQKRSRGLANAVQHVPLQAAQILGNGGVAATVANPSGNTWTATATVGYAFTAGFLPAWLAGAPLAAAVAEGQRLASGAVGRVGASPMVR